MHIAGGGLAGLALGVALRQHGVPTELHEAGSYPRHRVCGEFVSGITPAELETLGIADDFADAARPRSTVWYDTTRERLRAPLPQAAWGISRHQLDARLAHRFVELGGQLLTRSRVSPATDLTGWVWATGRPRRESTWLGLKAHFLDLPLNADLELHLGHRSYIGLTRVEHGRVNACGLFHRPQSFDASRRSDLLPQACEEAGLSKLADRLRHASLDADSLKGVNQFLLGWQPATNPEELRLGDFAAMTPPLTGNGMSMALQSALDALPPLLAWSQHRQDWPTTTAAVRLAQRQRFGGRLRWARLLQRIVLHPTASRLSLALLQRRTLPFDRLFALTR